MIAIVTILVFITTKNYILEFILDLLILKESESISCSVVSDSLRPHGLYSARLHCPWNSPGKKAGVSCHSLLQEIFLTQGSNPHLLPLQADCLSSEPWVVSIDYPGLRMNVVKKQTLNKKFTVGKGYKKYRVL